MLRFSRREKGSHWSRRLARAGSRSIWFAPLGESPRFRQLIPIGVCNLGLGDRRHVVEFLNRSHDSKGVEDQKNHHQRSENRQDAAGNPIGHRMQGAVWIEHRPEDDAENPPGQKIRNCPDNGASHQGKFPGQIIETEFQFGNSQIEAKEENAQAHGEPHRSRKQLNDSPLHSVEEENEDHKTG